MANTKISALSSATTPLAGTEVLPVVQSSTTKQVSVTNLTSGRTVDMSQLGVGGTATLRNGITVIQGTTTGTNFSGITVRGSTTGGEGCLPSLSFENSAATRFGSFYANLASSALEIATNGSYPVNVNINSTTTWTFDTSSNLVPATAAKGINFSANTPLAGKTSTLLNWYEEGTFTPNQGAGLTLVGAFSSTGKYTRIGRQVSISGTVTGATSVAVTAGGVITTSLPFTIGTAGHGDATNAAITASAAIICNTGTTVTSAGAIAATGTITFSATYFV
jgi:hypothetical protein